MSEIAVHRFPDGELRVTVGPAASTNILYVPLDQPNDKLVSVLFAAEALRRDGAERLVLVAPYLCYMRQDKAFQPGEAISQKVIGRLLARAFDRIVTVDAHLHRTANIQDVFPGIEADNLSAMPAIVEALQSAELDRRTIVAGPDAESEPWASDLARRLGLVHAVAQKVRHGDYLVECRFAEARSFVGRPVLLVDDIVSSGGTLIACANALAAAGALSIDVIVTHALFSAKLASEFAKHGIRSIRSTHSVPHPTNAIALDGLLAAALRNEVPPGCLTLESTS
jgi:ribose-phosphate pyrophosphokinase